MILLISRRQQMRRSLSECHHRSGARANGTHDRQGDGSVCDDEQKRSNSLPQDRIAPWAPMRQRKVRQQCSHQRRKCAGENTNVQTTYGQVTGGEAEAINRFEELLNRQSEAQCSDGVAEAKIDGEW